nr:ribonuclease H-like domain-containing protein [Tanacetum cinerariifolium]
MLYQMMTETESQGDDGESSVSDNVNNSISDSLGNDATTNDIAHLPTDDNIMEFGSTSKDVYMALPPGYFSMDDNTVCILAKSLYGLKQAPRQWNKNLCFVLLENGSQQSKSDYSLFINAKNNVYIALLMYVDDIVIIGNNLDEVNMCKNFL